jgi:hypothetical protein
MDAMADDATTIDLSRSELREVAGYAVACARPAWRSSKLHALMIGAHEPRSTLPRRSRMEPSGPRRYVTAPGRPTGRRRRPAMQDGGLAVVANTTVCATPAAVLVQVTAPGGP